MASRSFHALFLRAHDALERTGRRSHAVIVVLLLVHLLWIVPHAGKGVRQAEEAAERQRLEQLSGRLDELSQAFQQGTAGALEEFRPALDLLVGGLEDDFTRLQAARWEIQRNTSGDAASEILADPALRVEPPAAGVVPFELSPETIDRIRRATNRYGLLSVLEPVIDERVVGPRFSELQRNWQRDTKPRIQAELEAVAGVIPQWRGRFPEGKASWDGLSSTLGDLQATVALEFQPPDAPYWWASPETSPVLRVDLAPSIAQDLLEPQILSDLGLRLEEAQRHLAALSSASAAQLQALGNAESRDGYGQWLTGLGLDPRDSAPLFTPLVGLLVGIVLLRRGHRIRRLTVVGRLAMDHGGSDDLRTLILTELSGSSDLTLSTAAAERRAQARVFGALLLTWGWLALAGYQLHGPPEQGSPHWFATLAGAGWVLVAVLWRLWTQQQCLRWLDEDSDLAPHGALDPHEARAPESAEDTPDPGTETSDPQSEGPDAMTDTLQDGDALIPESSETVDETPLDTTLKR